MEKVEKFAQRLSGLQWRLEKLYQDANASSVTLPQELLPVAFKELGAASEELQVTIEELVATNEELAATRSQAALERQHYQKLLEFLPTAYLVSDIHGKILEANHAAATVLNISQEFLLDSLLINFIPSRERRKFRSQLNQLSQSDGVQEFELRLQCPKSEPLEAVATVAPVPNFEGKPVYLHWLLRDITPTKQDQAVLNGFDCNLIENYPIHFYSKGEMIPLKPSQLWLVSKGLVKLTTFDESGEELLVGLVSPSLPLSSSMTSLPIYQATAFSENVELISIPRTEIATSPRLSQSLLPKITERLRQTETLLTILGKRNLKDRLYALLLWLKQKFGQPTAQGTRLSIRLTHQELADICGTSRVTITRSLCQFQKQGKIMYDSDYHIILPEPCTQQVAS